MLNIQPIEAFTDNYIWLLEDTQTRSAFVVDPGDAAPVIARLEELDLALAGVLITHHHFDHVGGLATLRERYQPYVYGPDNPAIDGIDQVLRQGDDIEVFGKLFTILEVPGHTLDHIAYFHDGDEPLLFCGDTLFAGGCGRLFEGNPPMMLNSLEALAGLPDSTRVYCAHEYTLANLAFARAVEPDNAALAARLQAAQSTRKRGEPTVPSDIGLELATNPFLRCSQSELRDALAGQGRLEGTSPTEVFTTVRSWKDNF
ncbi:MAG: hydroxyacylglutathione hydrolase [Halioglobus sp.]|nr:hydroxyacylglutathione hydrolase [Halioglobus sp.]